MFGLHLLALQSCCFLLEMRHLTFIADFDRQKWFATLENHGVDGKHFDDDDLLIPKLVTELICPIVLHRIQVLLTLTIVRHKIRNSSIGLPDVQEFCMILATLSLATAIIS